MTDNQKKSKDKAHHLTPHRGIGLARVLRPKLQQPQTDRERVLHLTDMGVHLTDLDPYLLLPGWNLPNRTLNQNAKLNLTCRLVQDMQEGTRIQVTIEDEGHLIIHVHSREHSPAMSSPYYSRTSRTRVHEQSSATSSAHALNEQVTKMLKEIYSFVDYNRIKDIVKTASTMEPYNQGLLMEIISRKVIEMMAAACGFSSASSSSTEVTSKTSPSSMPLVTAPRVTVAKKAEAATATTTSTTTQPREVTIKDVNNNSKAMKRASSESLEVVVTKKKPKRQICFMTGCGQPASSLKRHVVGKHLTLVFAMWKEMSRDERMFSYNQSLMSLETALGLTTHDELLQMVVEKQWFPVGSRFTIPDEDVTFVKEFHQWLTGRQMTTEPTIDPPNCIAVLTNWRIFSTLLNCIGEEKVILPTQGVQSIEETAGATVAQPGKDAQLIKTDQVVQPAQVAQPETAGTTVAQPIDAQPGKDAQLIRTDQVVQPVQVAQPEVKGTKDVPAEEQPMEVDQCNQCESGDLAGSLAPSEEAVLLDSPSEDVRSVSSSILESPPKSMIVKDVGTPYEEAEWVRRRTSFLKVNSKDRVSFIDSHMHLNKLRWISHCRDNDTILDRGPMLATPVYLEAVLANFCHEAPSKELRQMWKRDSRIYYTHGLHSKLAHTATDEDFERVRTSIIKDPRCVGLGEIGFDFSAHFGKFKVQQTLLCRKFLQMFVKEELYYSKAIVIHCRDKGNSMDAYKTCLKVFEEEIPAFHREDISIHFHCFNGGLSTLRDWLARFPRIRIGVTGLLLRKGRNPELEAVVEYLDLEQILLETDSPYLTSQFMVAALTIPQGSSSTCSSTERHNYRGSANHYQKECCRSRRSKGLRVLYV